MEEAITFGLQPALEIECFSSNYDMKSYVVEFGLAPSIIPSFIIGLFSPAAGSVRSIAEKLSENRRLEKEVPRREAVL